MTTRTLTPALRYLTGRVRLGVKFGLGRMHALLAALGHPERAAPVLLVAGTNGKGSVVCYVDAVLRASGLRTGRYTSPHLVRINERIAVDGVPIASRALERAVLAVRDAARRLRRAGAIPTHPTFFEVVTAAAFTHFRHSRTDVNVVEVGLGGRLDATNTTDPIASAIVTIAHDHEMFLGSTLGSIAREKAGVARAGRPLVIGRLEDAARRAVKRVALRKGARVVEARAGSTLAPLGDGRIAIRTPVRRYDGLRPLPGQHQQDNLLVAIRLLEEARAQGLGVALERLPAAVSRAEWPGRLQWLSGSPRLLLDGAHNPAGAAALARYLEAFPAYVLVFGAMRDKDLRGLLVPLLERAREVVFTRPPLSRAASPEMLRRLCEDRARPPHVADAPARALARARRLALPGEPVVVAGSLYLVGEILRIVGRKRGNRLSESPVGVRRRAASAGSR